MNGAANMEQSEAVTVGMACTVHIGSDCYGATVVAVSASGHRVTVRREQARRGFHIVDPTGETETFTRRADGRYRRAGSKRGWFLRFGQRVSYRDPSF